jgi:hypothetical protein
MTYFPALRRDYILWRLAVNGELQRADIMRTFGISEAQASGDINTLLADMPTSIRYDKSRKRYVPPRTRYALPRVIKIAEALQWS